MFCIFSMNQKQGGRTLFTLLQMWNRPKLGVLVEVEEEVRTEQQSIRGPQRERRTIKFFRHDHHIYHNRHNRWLFNFLRRV